MLDKYELVVCFGSLLSLGERGGVAAVVSVSAAGFVDSIGGFGTVAGIVVEGGRAVGWELWRTVTGVIISTIVCKREEVS